jgi:hypothetical protein
MSPPTNGSRATCPDHEKSYHLFDTLRRKPAILQKQRQYHISLSSPIAAIFLPQEV